MIDHMSEVYRWVARHGADDRDEIKAAFSEFVATSHSLHECQRRPSDSVERRVAKGSLLPEAYMRVRSRRGWPREHGGRGGDARSRAAMYDALTAAGDVPRLSSFANA